MGKKVVAIILILFGVSLVLATIYMTIVQPEDTDVFKTAAGIVGGLGSLAGGIKAWMDLLKKSNGKTSVEAKDESQVIVNGRGSKNIRTDIYAEQYFEAPRDETQPQSLLGLIPPASTEAYVHRGKIESDVRSALKGNGVAAIVGLHAPGGVGKTELAKQVMQEMKGQFEDVLWVDIGEKTPEQVVVAMLLACGQKPPDTYTEQKQNLQALLAKRCLLVVLDDLRSASKDKLADFLPPAPPCAVLITSRIEQPSHLVPLKNTFELNRMTPDQARELLEAALGADLVKAEAQAAEDLAKRVLWNPLALEIAARRIRQVQGVKKPIERYLKKLEKGLSELKVGEDPRLNMQAVFDISYEDLTELDRKRFRFLAVFHPTGFDPQAAMSVWGDTEEDASNALSRLQNLSLLKPVPGDFDRYRLHDLLDDYASEKLKQAGDFEVAVQNLAEWLIQMFDEHYTDDPSNAPEVALEFDNLQKAIEQAIFNKDGNILALLATKPRNWLFNYFRKWEAWQVWLETALDFGIGDDQLKANVLQAIGDVQQFRKENDAALTSYNEALQLFRAVGDRLGEANVFSALGQLSLIDDPEAADALLNQAISIYQKIGSRYSIPAQIGNFGWALRRLGERKRAKPYLLRAAKLFEEIGLMDYAERHYRAAGEDNDS